MAKPINILHSIPKPLNTSFIVVPIGLYCNVRLQKAKPGDVIELWQDWRHEKRRIVRTGRFRINMPEFTFMLRCIYGERMTVARLLKQWEADCVNDGIGANGFNREQCLVLEIETINEQ